MTREQRVAMFESDLADLLAEDDSLAKADGMLSLSERPLWYLSAETRERLTAVSVRARAEYRRLAEAGHHP